MCAKCLTFSDIQIFIARLILKKIQRVIHKRLTDRLSPAKTELFPFLKQLRDLREKIPYNSPSLYFSVVAFFAPTAEPSPYLRQLPRQTAFHIAQGSALFPRSVYRRYEMRIIVIYVPEKYFTKKFIKRLV